MWIIHWRDRAFADHFVGVSFENRNRCRNPFLEVITIAIKIPITICSTTLRDLTPIHPRVMVWLSQGSRPVAEVRAKAESVPKGFGTDPLNLIQVMLAKGRRFPLPFRKPALFDERLL